MLKRIPDWAAICEHGPRDTCNCALSATGTEQSLDELEFSRSACSAAQDGDVAKLRRILQRNPTAVGNDGASGPQRNVKLSYIGRKDYQVSCVLVYPPCITLVSFIALPYRLPYIHLGGSYTPLHYAARGGHLDAVELLLQKGANPNAATRGMGATPLHRAAMQGHFFVVERLLAAGADARAVDCDLETPLHKAAVQGHGEVCRLLLERCPEAGGAADKAGRTPGQRATGRLVRCRSVGRSVGRWVSRMATQSVQ
ncbi:hypothetical protein Vretifemale_7433 [Volvox reticuliferus]|nr:hypothetical protein Vretifemale_7433 [Volvox reticuliferus]